MDVSNQVRWEATNTNGALETILLGNCLSRVIVMCWNLRALAGLCIGHYIIEVGARAKKFDISFDGGGQVFQFDSFRI